MNELDSELVGGQLRALGYRFTQNRDQADIVLYNTCSVREHAEQKVWSRLGELVERKKAEPSLVVGVLGCLAERDGTDLMRRMPVVDVMVGPGELDKLPALLDNAVKTRESMLAEGVDPGRGVPKSARLAALQGNTSRRSATLAAAADTLELLDLSRAVSPLDDTQGPQRSAYVRVTRGCNKFCTYCVVPFTRGAEVHRPPEHIIDECKKLADSGVIEITLLGQTVNHYRFEHGAAVTVNGFVQPQKGRSYSGGHRRDPFAGANVTTFADLLRRIHDEVPSILRLRFVTSYPRDFGDDVLEVIRDHPRICRYLHVPAQSGSNRMLAAMNRGYTVEEYTEFLDRARAHLHEPHKGRPCEISGDFIVGFPGETDEDFEATKALVRRARYKNAFIFKYSPRPGTVAFEKLPDDIPDAVKRRRNNELLALQGEISAEQARAYVGLEMPILVEGHSVRERKKQAAAGACGDAPRGISLTVNGASVEPAHGHGSACAIDDEPEPAPPQVPGVDVQLSGRTDTDMIVVFNAPARDVGAMVGTTMRVRILSATALALVGEAVVPNQ
ncbi:MAG: MiaB/RimO family radical SAM methylthiotransferase [Planctomycetes bacterium]|nr:MiaB/RimO family radical SAM methylthiotransferase [Planctomycetota bacterium]